MSLSIKTSGPVVRIDLARPDEGNAMTLDMMRELAKSVREYGANPDTRVIAIAPRGEQFCRGRDVGKSPPGGAKPSAYHLRTVVMAAVLGVYDALAACPVPTVACVQGDALGFGAAMAAAADITLVSDHALLGFVEIEHNIPPALAMASVIGKMPSKMLTWLTYSAEKIRAEQAVSFGLASKVLPRERFEKESNAFLDTLAGRPRLVLETIKRYQTKATGLSPDMASEYAGTLLALVSTAE
jgi:enoyl-CoA hydratase/carnithine racemase